MSNTTQVLAPRPPRAVITAVTLLFLVAVCTAVDGIIILTHLSAFSHAARNGKIPSGTTPDAVAHDELVARLVIGIILVVFGAAIGWVARTAMVPGRRARMMSLAAALIGFLCFGCGGYLTGDAAVPNDTGTSVTSLGGIAVTLLVFGTLASIISLVLLSLRPAREYYSGAPIVSAADEKEAF